MSAQAGTIWDGGGVANTNINTAANWDSDTLPTSLTDGTQTLTFGTGGSTATINTDVSALGLVINRDSNFTIADGAGNLTIGTGGITVTLPTATARTHTISESNLTLAGNQTWSVTNNTGTATLNVSSAITDGASTFNLSKNGSGILTLSGANTYDGVTTINAGTLTISNNNALGSTVGGTTIAAGANLNLQGDITVAETLAHNGNLLRNVSGNNSWNGDITLGSSSRIQTDAGLLTIGGNISLVADSIFQGNSNTTVTGVISGSFAIYLGSSMGVSSVLTLSGNNSYTGRTFIQSGTLSANTLKDFGTNSSIGRGTINQHIELGGTANNGTLNYTGGATSSNRTIRVGSSTASHTGNAGINNNGSGALVFTASVFNAVTTVTVNRNLTLGGTNTDLNNIQGVIANNSGGTVGLIKADAGTWALSGANTYSGATTINNGILVFRNTSARSANTAVTVATTGIVGLGVGAASGDYSDANVAALFNSTLTGFTLNAASGVALDTTAGNFTQSTALTASRALTKLGNNTLTLNGSNTYSGDTTISAGTLALGGNGSLGGGAYSGNIANSGTFTLNTTAAQTLSGILSGNGTLTKSNTGTLTLSGNNTYAGSTTISAGVLNIQHANALGATAGNTTVSSGGALQLQGDITVGAEALSLTGNGVSTDGALRNISGSNTYGGAITLAGATRINSDAGLLTLSGAIGGNTQNLTIGGAGNTTISNAIGTTTGTLTKDGAGTLTLSGANTYDGVTTVSVGVLNIQNNTALGTTVGSTTVSSGAALQLQGSITVGAEALSLTGNGVSTDGALRNVSGSNTYGGAITLAGATRINSDAGLLTLSGAIGGNTQNLTIGGAGNTTISNAIGTTTGALTKDGAGTLTLSSANTFTGGATINAGTLQLGNAGALNITAGSENAVTFGAGSTGALSLNGNSAVIRSLNSNATPGTPVVQNANAATATLTVGNSANATSSYAGVIQDGTGGGALSLTKAGAGTLTLSGSNTYNGTTTINAGTLTISNNNALGSTVGGTTIAAGANLNLQGDITVAETLAHNGNLLRNVSGNNSWNGDITLGSSSRIQTDAGLLTIGGNISLVADSIFQGNSNTTVTGVISGSFAIFLGSSMGVSSVLTLSGNNSYTGRTYIQSGTLSANTLKDFGTNSSIGQGTINQHIELGGTANNGTLSYTGGATSSNRTIRVGSSTGNHTGNAVINNNGSGALVFTASVFNAVTTVTVNRNLTLGGTNTDLNSIQGVIANNSGGTVGLIKADAGTWALSGANTYSGATTINAGTLQIGVGGASGNLSISSAITNNGTLVFNRSGNMTQGTNFANSISGTGNLTQAGSGTLFLGGTNSYTGLTTISAGNLSISTTTALGSTSGINLANATALIYNGSAATLDRAITVTSGTGTIRNTGGALTLSGALTKNGTALTLAGGTNGITVTGVISGSNANSDLVIDGGTTTLANANDYNGPTFMINGGTLNANFANALPTANGRTAISIDAIGTGSSTLALGTNQSIASLEGATTSTVSLGTNSLTIGSSSNTTSANYAGRITGTSNSALVKDGESTQVLSGNNTGFTGRTTINNGTLTANSTNALGGTTHIDLHGGSLLVAAANAVNDDASINLNGGRLAMNGNFSENIGALTLSKDSIIDFSGFVGTLRFSGIGSWAAGANLAIWNWSGQNQYGTNYGTYPNSTNLVFTNNATLSSNLANISFYSDSGTTSIGSGFERGFTGGGTEIIAVPEPETVITAVVLLLGFTFYQLRLARHGQGLLSRISFLRCIAKRNLLEG